CHFRARPVRQRMNCPILCRHRDDPGPQITDTPRSPSEMRGASLSLANEGHDCQIDKKRKTEIKRG
ncbi:MAG: hypothetical protein M3Z19_18220, partial [Chloroflexota bacterium]|nr:hypothetical protein [Chloroflexota bacterium]